MTWLCRALPNNFIASSERIACAAGIIFVPGNLASASILSEGSWQGRKEQEQAAHLRSERALRTGRASTASATSAALGRVVAGRSSSRLRETSESLLLENRRDRGRTQLFPTLIESIPDVVHRRVLLAQGDDLLTSLSWAAATWPSSFVAERTLAEGFCGTHGTGRENSRVCSRTARPASADGALRRKTCASLVLSMGWVGGEQEFIGEVG